MATITEKPATTPEELARKKAVKLIGYHGWLADWRAANPDADSEARKVAWAEVRSDRMRAARRVVKRIEKGGVAFVPAPIAAE